MKAKAAATAVIVVSALIVGTGVGTADRPSPPQQPGATPTAPATSTASISTGASALAVADAIAADPSTVAGAAFEAQPSPVTAAVTGEALAGMPTSGSSYGILSTGDASITDQPNDSGSSGSDVGGANVRGNTDYDVTILRIDLNVPSGTNCLIGFDFRFLSEEYPEYVGTAFNDAFIAEVDKSTWTTNGSSISAPGNFAFDPSGNPITINAAGVTSMTAANAAGTTFDGATPLLRAVTPITPGAHSLYLSIFDQGDHIYDSAVMLDNLQFGHVADVANDCKPGAVPVDRYVALGDSVPYGHGLANPYPSAQVNFPSNLVSQGPSNSAYPALVAKDLHLSMSIRQANCALSGDDLTVSGAPMAASDTTAGNNQCSQYATNLTVQGDEYPAANLSANPAQLVTVQAGADDINFSSCLLYEITKDGFHIPFFTHSCVNKGQVTPAVFAKLQHVHDALVQLIESIASHAKEVAILNYYQIIPSQSDFSQASIFPDGQVNPVCWGLSHNTKGAHDDAVIILNALNAAIGSAVAQARLDGINNVVLVDLSSLEDHHEMCTGSPAIFSGEPMSKFNFHVTSDRTDIEAHAWRAGHPNSFGQVDIAKKVESALP